MDISLSALLWGRKNHFLILILGFCNGNADGLPFSDKKLGVERAEPGRALLVLILPLALLSLAPKRLGLRGGKGTGVSYFASSPL